ncbi:MAG: YggS family pyridoxal phosphate-dependent enzyme [Planctomycetota bacterium]
MDSPLETCLKTNLRNVEKRIQTAAARVDRDPAGVTLVAITKSVTTRVAKTLFDIGVQNLGENRVQELQKKSLTIRNATWHLVGPLQSNKTRKAIQSAALLHAIDAAEMLPRISTIAQSENCNVHCCIEVNVSMEATKHGVAPDEIISILENAKSLPRVFVDGLMTMAPAAAPPGEIRNIFKTLRILRDAAGKKNLFTNPRGELSMGMSNDFEIAVEEGATLVRVGSALFDNLPDEPAPLT